ncbi:MAG: SpoIIE family protein phosphatase [Clostridia bacterium]|nr:SpoIIE family protein phosphatase [Clostridia bacterium]
MLRTIRLQTVSMPRFFTDDLARSLFFCLSAALLARVQPVPGLMPFAVPLLAACLAAGVNPLFVLAGALTGAVHSGGFQPAAALSCAAAAAGVLLLRRLPERFSADASLSVLSGLSVLIPGAPLAAGGPWESLRWMACAAAAAAGAPFFRAWAGVRLSRRHLMPEERVGLILFLCACAAGLSALWTPLALTASMAVTILSAGLGPGAAACTGLGAGAVLMLTGLEPVRAAGLGVCGMIAGLAPPRQRWLAPLLFATAACLSFLTVGTPWPDPVCALTAASVSLILPESWTGRARQWLSGEARGACDPDRLAMRLRAESERKLRALSAAFGELSDSYRLPVDVPDEQHLIAEMRDHLCENCPHYARCWVSGDNRTVRFLCQLISEAIDWANGDCAEPLFGDEMPPDVLRQCHRGRTIPQRLGVLLEEFARKRRSEMKRGQVNQLISAQFMQAQMLLGGLADAQARPMRIRGRQAARARAALDRAGVEAAEVMALRGARQMEIVAALRRGCWSPELAARASAQLSRTFGRAYVPGESPGCAEMKFVRLARMKAGASACCHSRQAGTPCGDSHMIRPLEGERLLMMISDGMGSGEDAARESAQTLRLLGQFLEADVDRELALETVNELMLARTDSDMFATVDMCVIDLAAGTAEFLKLAACRSVIVRKEEILIIEGGRLPLGILEGVSASRQRVELEPGDVVVMASDGVMDALGEEEMERVLLEFRHQPPEMLAETVVRRAEARTDAARRDDMTVVCARVTQRRTALRAG